MKVPSFLLGEQSSVAKACRAKAKWLVAGGAWESMVDGYLDTADHEEALVLIGRRYTRGSFFHMNALLESLWGSRTRPEQHLVERWLAEAVQSPWGALCVASDTGRLLMQRRPERQMLFLDGLANALPEIEALGARFALLGLQPYQNVPSLMYSTLGMLGADREELEAVFKSSAPPPSGLAQWLRAQITAVQRKSANA